MHKTLLALLGISSSIFAAQNTNCAPEPAATCYPDDCKRCYCLGPENYGANAPVCPLTCNGDWKLSLVGLYWNAYQDGMEYAINNRVKFPDPDAPVATGVTAGDILAQNNLIDANFENPNFNWDFGFKFGIGYCTTCDGWDIGAEWTWFQGSSNDHVETEADDNHTLLPICTAFAGARGGPAYASDIETRWKLELNLVDLELGRSYWTSKYLALRPFVGLRIASIEQEYNIHHKGGTWSVTTPDIVQPALNNDVSIENNFKGVGLRAGLDTTWNFGCGWALYGDLATSVVYGRFDWDYNERNREASNPHDKTKIAEAQDSFRASRAMFDLALGVQWSTMLCDCQYGLTIGLGWEHHLFFDQNQMWRINRIGDTGNTGINTNTANGSLTGVPNNTGENVYHQRRGDLSTQGLTFTVDFSF